MSKPFAHYDRCMVGGVPVIRFYNLMVSQLEVLRSVMLFNGTTDLHEARSEAMAHLGLWDSDLGRADIYLHTPEPGHRDAFISMLRDTLRINIPRVPQADYLQMA